MAGVAWCNTRTKKAAESLQIYKNQPDRKTADGSCEARPLNNTASVIPDASETSQNVAYASEVLQVSSKTKNPTTEKARVNDVSSEFSPSVNDVWDFTREQRAPSFPENDGNVDSDQTTPILKIPAELLDYIFTFLDIRERIRAERVCKKWRILGREQVWSSPKEFAFGDWKLYEKSSLYGTWHLNSEILEGLLFRFGLIVRDIKLSNLSHQVSINADAFKIISRHCPNLTHIEMTLSNISLPLNSLTKLGKGCPKLKDIDLQYLGGDKLYLKSFFKSCKELESLKLTGDPLCPEGSDFDTINENLKILHLGMETLKPSTLRKIKDRCVCLEDFYVNIDYACCQLATKKIYFDAIERYCSTLTTLHLLGCETGVREKWCTFLNKLRQLQELCIVELENFNCHCKKTCGISSKIKLLTAISTEPSDQEENFLKKLFGSNDSLHIFEMSAFGWRSLRLVNLLSKYADCMLSLVFSNCDMKFYAVNNWCKLLSVFHNLNKLSILFCSAKINDDLARAVSQNCLKLRVLHLSDTDITDDGLLAISSLPCLVDVGLISSSSITDKGIRVLVTKGRLEKLNITSSTGISDASCCLLAKFCPNFCELQAAHVVNISNNLVSEFHESIVLGYFRSFGIRLVLTGTSVTMDYQKHDRLYVTT